MTSQPETTYLTPEEYLAVERQNEHKSEYLDGEMVAITGASRRHSLITTRSVSPRVIRRKVRAYECSRR